MASLWRARAPPKPLSIDGLADRPVGSVTYTLPDERVWSPRECADVFARSVSALARRLTDQHAELLWDKDDDEAMDFVTAAANLRAQSVRAAPRTRTAVDMPPR